MKMLHGLPLAHKLVLFMMVTSGVALLVAGSFSFSDARTASRRSLADQLHILADVIGANAAAALSFNDPKGAALVLQTLHTERHITAAYLYDADGQLFASYGRDSFSPRPPAHPPAIGSHWTRDRITNAQPVLLDGRPIGTIALESDLDELSERERRNVLSAVIFAFASLAAAMLMALWLKHLISRPILDLARTAKTVSREKNFGIRATHATRDDFGLLVESINEMLGEIEQRDSTLKHEVMDRLYAEQALRAAHSESELFINSVPSILIGTDARGRITRWNLAAANTFGLPASAVRGHTLKDCGIIWLNAGIEVQIDSWTRVERSERRDNLMFQKGDDRHFLGVTISRVEFLSQGGTGFLITGTDVTERKQLEEQLRQAQKLEAIGQLAAGIAHEINTPAQYVGDNTQFLKESWPVVSGLLGLCQALREESKTGTVSAETISRLAALTEQADLAYLLEETPRAIDQSLEGVQRVAKIVKAIKEFSHPGSEEKRAVDINRAIETTITVARNEWKYVAEVVTHFDSSLPPVPCLAGEFNQVILNLLINAAQAVGDKVGDGSNGKGTITITTRREDDQAEIRIQDTGKGVPESIRARIFEPFFTTKPVGKGTGQGLAIAHSVIVKKHDGQIWFDSEAGKGTTFFVRLPLVASTQAAVSG